MTRSLRLAIPLAVVVLMPALTPSPASGGQVRTAPSSIADDCSADVSRPLTRWFRSLPDGSVARLSPGGCYRTEREIVLRNKRNFVLDGRGATLRRTTYTPPALRYPKANGILRVANLVDSTIQNLTIRGTNTKSDLSYLKGVGSWHQEVEFDAGLGLHGLLRTTVSDVRVRAVWGDGVYLAGSDQWANRRSNHVVLRRVRVTKNGRAGIAINRSHNILLDRVSITLSRRSGINMEPDTPDETIEGIEIRRSRIAANLNAISAWGAGRVNGVNIHDNLIGRTGVPWVKSESYEGLDRKDWTVENNVVGWPLGSPMPAMAFWNTQGVRILGNLLAVATTQSQLAVGLYARSSGTVSCNAFLGASRSSVLVEAGGTVAEANNLMSPGPTGCPTSAFVERHASSVSLPRLAFGTSTPLVGYAKQLLHLAETGDRFDASLQAAVQKFQSQHGWPSTGVIDTREWRALTR